MAPEGPVCGRGFIRSCGENFTYRKPPHLKRKEDGGVAICCNVNSERIGDWGPVMEGFHITLILNYTSRPASPLQWLRVWLQ